jgi:hypothetical protein
MHRVSRIVMSLSSPPHLPISFLLDRTESHRHFDCKRTESRCYLGQKRIESRRYLGQKRRKEKITLCTDSTANTFAQQWCGLK